jgi:hypothetical protein
LDAAVQAYIDGIEPAHRALFELLYAIVLAQHTDAQVALSYGMPGYRVGKRRLNLGSWAHGVSVYGWRRDRDGGFAARHPELLSGKSTIRLRTSDASALTDDELRTLLGGALEP